jgi:hypothetical protein
LYYNFGNYAYDQWAFITYGDGAFPQINKGKRQLNRWQKAGDIAAAPKYVYNNGTSSNAVSSRYIYSADYVRLSNITIGYDFNNRILEKFKVSSLRFYVRGSNLFTWLGDKDLPFDPEQGITGINDLQVPIVRTITVGINAGF